MRAVLRVAAAGLVEEIAALVEPKSEDGARLHNKVPPTQMVEADREQLFRVVLNLARALSYDTQMDGKALLITLQGTGAAAGAGPAGAATTTHFAEAPGESRHALRNVVSARASTCRSYDRTRYERVAVSRRFPHPAASAFPESRD